METEGNGSRQIPFGDVDCDGCIAFLGRNFLLKGEHK